MLDLLLLGFFSVSLKEVMLCLHGVKLVVKMIDGASQGRYLSHITNWGNV